MQNSYIYIYRINNICAYDFSFFSIIFFSGQWTSDGGRDDNKIACS